MGRSRGREMKGSESGEEEIIPGIRSEATRNPVENVELTGTMDLPDDSMLQPKGHASRKPLISGAKI